MGKKVGEGTSWKITTFLMGDTSSFMVVFVCFFLGGRDVFFFHFVFHPDLLCTNESCLLARFRVKSAHPTSEGPF